MLVDEAMLRAITFRSAPDPDLVARTRAEVAEAHAAWTGRDPRFGAVASSLEAIDVGPPPWTARR